jgi:hypothetical protein
MPASGMIRWCATSTASAPVVPHVAELIVHGRNFLRAASEGSPQSIVEQGFAQMLTVIISIVGKPSQQHNRRMRIPWQRSPRLHRQVFDFRCRVTEICAEICMVARSKLPPSARRASVLTETDGSASV